MNDKVEGVEDKEGEVNLFPLPVIPYSTLDITQKAFKKTTQMNRVVTIEQNKRNLAIVGWGILFIFCISAGVVGLGDEVNVVFRCASGFILFGLILLAKSVLMWVGLKRRK